jgi:hypothetical protein
MWKLISKTGNAPVVEVWEYTGRGGRHYVLTYSYYYNVFNKKYTFGCVHLQARSRSHSFKTLHAAIKYLKRRKVPLDGLEPGGEKIDVD